jgi:hypothetical protein
MPKYSVLITTQEYVEMEGEDAEDAEMKAYKSWKNGEFFLDTSYPEFICEEVDLIEEEEDEHI